MKKTISIFFLSALLFSCTGGWILFRLRLLANYTELSTRLNNSDLLVKFSMSKSVYERTKINSDELLINGKMYDIKSVNIKATHIELTGFADKHEDNLVSYYENYQNTKKDHTQRVLPFNFFSFLFTESFKWFDFKMQEIELCFCFHTIQFPANEQHVESPPPKA